MALTEEHTANAPMVPDQTIAPGDIVSGLEPTELVEVTRLAPFAGKMLIEGITVESRRQIKRPLTPEQVHELRKVRGATTSFDGSPLAFMLGSEALRVRIAHQFDPLFAVNASIVDPLPHQIEAVYRYLLPLPRIRFLLADDTGAGKTIMAGLLIKELLFRGVIEKVLIITPGGLTKQWQEDEMRGKFGLPFRLVNRASFEADPAQFARAEEGLFVTSIDFISRHEGCLKAAEETPWDMIIVDEAHKLSAYEYGAKVDKSERYKALERLAHHTDHLLFLTATPHRGRKDTFRRLLMLLDDDLFSKDEHVTERVIREQPGLYSMGGEDFDDELGITKARNRFFLRRLKEEMVNWDGDPLFKQRHTKTVGYDLTPEEMVLYRAVTDYVRSKRQQARAQKNRNVELTVMVMQRRLASSIYAITCTLRNRRNALDNVLTLLRDPNRPNAEKKRLLRATPEPGDPTTISDYEELDESERAAIDKRIFGQVLTDDPAEVEKERDQVADLLAMAEGLSEHREAKFAELLGVLDSSDVIRADTEKLLIFTEHRDTMDNLTKRLTEKGYAVTNIHGQMDVDARKQAQRDFLTKAKIMVATDAAGEGINLQFCRYLINWDIPWNPNRLEQRMGRIHRYGQRDEIYVYNMVAQDTREGKVLKRVLDKMDTMREQMGNDRVYDVVADVFEEVPLVSLMEKAIDDEDENAAVQTVEADLAGDNLKQRADHLIELQKKTSLASHLDLRAARDLRDTSDEHRLQPLFIQNFFVRAYRAAGGSVELDKHHPIFHVGPTPAPLLDLARTMRQSLRDKYDMPFVFDKNLVSVASRVSVPDRTTLLGPGHALFETLIEWAIRNAAEAFARGAVLIDPNIARPQHAWLVRSTVEDGRVESKKRLAHEQLSLVISDHDGFHQTSPSYLLTCTPPEATPDLPDLSQHTREEIQLWSYGEITEKQLTTVEVARGEECALRRQYLETAFTDLIMDLQEKLNEVQQAQLFGGDDPEQRHALEKRVVELRERKKARLVDLELMLNLTANLPDVLAEAIIVPAPVAITETDNPPSMHGGVPMRRDDEVEAIAMDVAMRYEWARGWTPYDVSKDGEHYDVRSESPTGEKRYIEVKGRAQSGPVMLTGPELDKLRQLGDRAWLYVVTYCKGERPRLRIVCDPGARLTPEMLYRQVQWLVDERDWSSQGEEIDMAPTLEAEGI